MGVVLCVMLCVVYEYENGMIGLWGGGVVCFYGVCIFCGKGVILDELVGIEM